MTKKSHGWSEECYLRVQTWQLPFTKQRRRECGFLQSPYIRTFHFLIALHFKMAIRIRENLDCFTARRKINLLSGPVSSSVAIEPFGHVWLFFDRRAFKSRFCLGSSTSRARLKGTERDFYWLSANAWNCVSTCTLSRYWEKRSQTAWQAVFSGMEILHWADNKVA